MTAARQLIEQHGRPHAKFHEKFRSWCVDLFGKVDVVCFQEISDFWAA